MNAAPAPTRGPMHRFQNVHFVGIGGAGMSGIAEVLINLGFSVTGSDQVEGAATRRLRGLGAEIHIGHDARWIEDAQVLVTSTAVQEDNPELKSARERRIPVVARAQMLGELMRFRRGIAVAGTHGKTTTTSLIASVLAAADMDPTYVIGGLLNSTGSNARLGTGEYLVAEADESDGSFLFLQPILEVITNIDRDHLGSYENDFSRLCAAFSEFVHHLPFYGVAVVCLDDPIVTELLPTLSRTVLTYGLDPEADVSASNVRQEGTQVRFDVTFPDDRESVAVTLGLPGKHNVRNALAAAAVGWELGVGSDAIVQGLAGFTGIGRRFDVSDSVSLCGHSVTVVDDYGHHPTELAATIQAARDAWPQRRLVLLFQPHRYTRTRDLFEDFVNVLSTVDELVLAEVYAAGEAPITGADGRALCGAVRARGQLNPVFVEKVSDSLTALETVLKTDDVLILQGAGNIGALANDIRSRADAPLEAGAPS